jgi:hypothetical protein
MKCDVCGWVTQRSMNLAQVADELERHRQEQHPYFLVGIAGKIYVGEAR